MDTRISTVGLLFERYCDFLAGHFTVEDDFNIYLVIYCLALYLEGTEIFLRDILLLKTCSVRYLVIDCLALYLKGTEIFLLDILLLKTISG